MDKEADHIKAKRRVRELNKHLRDLTAVVTQCIAALDTEMVKPSNPERGSRIATICNALNLQNDIARRFGLGERSLESERSMPVPTKDECEVVAKAIREKEFDLGECDPDTSWRSYLPAAHAAIEALESFRANRK